MRLPTEQETAASFGVSRTVVREAVAALRSEGLVNKGALAAGPLPGFPAASSPSQLAPQGPAPSVRSGVRNPPAPGKVATQPCAIRCRLQRRLETPVRHEPTSAVFGAMLNDIGPMPITLDHVLHRLGERSFGMMLLFLSILGLLPGTSALAGLMGLVVAWQMVLGRPRPVFPQRLAQRQFEPRRLRAIVGRIVPVLRWLERIVRPRWTAPLRSTKRVVGAAVALLALALLVPLPLSNLAPAITMGLVAVAYMEEDGLLLSAALLIAAILLVGGGLLAWEVASKTGWIESAF